MRNVSVVLALTAISLYLLAWSFFSSLDWVNKKKELAQNSHLTKVLLAGEED